MIYFRLLFGRQTCIWQKNEKSNKMENLGNFVWAWKQEGGSGIWHVIRPSPPLISWQPQNYPTLFIFPIFFVHFPPSYSSFLPTDSIFLFLFPIFCPFIFVHFPLPTPYLLTTSEFTISVNSSFCPQPLFCTNLPFYLLKLIISQWCLVFHLSLSISHFLQLISWQPNKNPDDPNISVND